MELAAMFRFVIVGLGEMLPQKKAGIYQINCMDCEKIYTVKTKREWETMVKEHFKKLKKGDIERSAVAA